MLSTLFNWRTILGIIAVLIVVGTVVYSNNLTNQIQEEERKKIALWIEAKNTEIKAGENDGLALTLAGFITQQNSTIPIIWTNEKDSIIEFINGDTNAIKKDSKYSYRKLTEFKNIHPPIIWNDPLDSTQKSKLFFGTSKVYQQLKWYPIIQLLIVSLFILITIIALQSRNKSTQNQVWAGMAKETAHQLGTPLSSLNGWVEVLRDSNISEEVITEMEKDIKRLDLISDRFGKIGSTPKFEETDVTQHVTNMAAYMRKRASGKVMIEVHKGEYNDTTAAISPQLFDWVIENLIKNALDALEGKGTIHIFVNGYLNKIQIDVTDTGKGIPRNKWIKIFKPGFTTKKRGWGLGLSLVKRIVEQYHQGSIFIKESEVGKGTTFRIILPRTRA